MKEGRSTSASEASLPETPRANRYVLPMVYLSTEFAVAAPMLERSARTVADALLSRCVLLFGALRRLFTDHGPNVESAVVQNLFTIWCINKVPNTAYHRAGNGACARLNQTRKSPLQKMVNEKRLEEWDVVRGEVMFVCDTSVHSRSGFARYFNVFAVEARVPSGILVGVT